MDGEVREAETAKDVARDYAEDECVGQFGAVTDVRREESSWVVEFRTHTYADECGHYVRINQVGTVYAHERDSQFG